MKSLGLLAIVPLLFAAAPAAAQEAPVDSLALARQYTAWLYAGRADSLTAHAVPDDEPADYARLSSMIAERAGLETGVIEETWKRRGGACQYWRTARFSGIEEPILVRWVLAPDGRIAGIGAGPLSQAPPVESETCAPPAETPATD